MSRKWFTDSNRGKLQKCGGDCSLLSDAPVYEAKSGICPCTGATTDKEASLSDVIRSTPTSFKPLLGATRLQTLSAVTLEANHHKPAGVGWV